MNKNKFKKGDLLIIKWIDSYSNSRWYTDDEVDNWLEDKCIITSVGYLYVKTKRYIAIYADVYTGEKARFMKIPMGIIKKIRRVN